MRKTVRLTLGLLIAFVCWAAAMAAELPRQHPGRAAALNQVGVIDALLAGGYQGSMSLGELKRLGDFGLGTFDALDGEMILLDGVVYQAPVNGHVRRPPDSLTTPFAQVTRFASDLNCVLPAGADLKAVEARLDAAIGDANCFAATRIDATFASLTARSVPAQKPPYRPLAEVAKEQAVFPFTNARGTLVGMRGPAFVRGLGVPGWHWHFLTADRKRGGHVMAFTLAQNAQPEAKLMRMRRFTLALPEAGLSGFDLTRDRGAELKGVESGR
ncbi:MAG: alpha-acetolactate decarboxylase [Desulfovibrionaceae bacterium CG1_02_65_16]|nr:MAG: alpha-acetolactate decarboxylase [Desulfovibrionaceae bacterium CG1_02_65_16]